MSTTTASAEPIPPGPDMSDLMELSEVAQRLGCHVETLRLQLKTGELDIPTFQIGRRVYIDRRVFAEWWDQRARRAYQPHHKQS